VRTPIERTKQTIRKYRTEIAFGAGIIVGAAGMYKLVDNVNGDMWLSTSSEKLQQLIDEPGGAIRCESPLRTVYVINELNPQI
jgi:hypothetical protein